MYTVTKRLEIAGAHYLDLPYVSKCRNLHGHNWIITVTCQSEKLNECGMVTDFALIKKEISDRLDHQYLNNIFNFNPTAENIAKWIHDVIPNCTKVSVQESEGNIATYEEAPCSRNI